VTRRRWAVLCAALALFASSFAGSCSGKDPAHTDGSQPRKGDVDTRAPEQEVAFPDSFPNVVEKCGRHGEAIYVVSDDGAQPVIVQNAPWCRGAGR
jgi:hypothetical protein